MTKIGLGQFIVIGFLAAVLAGIAAGANGTYAYSDDFFTEKAKTDSCIQSQFWLDRATPPPGPYVYYLDDGWDRQLVLMGYQNQLAELGYCFETGAQRAAEGWLTVEVSFPSTAILSQEPSPGQLLYSVSSDGIAWSQLQWLEAGRHQVPLESPTGTVYVLFSGTRVAINRVEVSLSSPAATISVPGTFSTIQAAVSAAVDGDIIEVGPGEYSGRGNYDIDFGGKAITLRSAAGPLHTIINVGAGRRGFHFRNGEGADSVVSGFTIRNAHLPNGNGGGIYCEFSSPTITNCIIENCTAVVGGGIGGLGAAPTMIDSVIRGCSATYGGAIGLLDQSDATMTRCEIIDNVASHGGGVYVSDSLVLIGGSRISANVATANGGGVYSVGALTDATIRNCVIASNTADVGAGIYTQSAPGFPRGRLTVNHGTIADNQAPYPQPGGLYSENTDLLVTNSILWGNGTNPVAIGNPTLMNPVTYSNVEGGYWGQGNLNENPLFANPGAGDYRLRSRHGRYDPQSGWVYNDWQDSPCIDAGDPGSSAAAEPAPNGGRVNMGAYGATRQASKSVEHTIWHVDTTGGRDLSNRGRSQAQAFRTIGYALDMAQSGDTVLVWPGVYREELVFDNKAVTLRSAADAAILEAPDAYAVSFYHAESSRSTLANFVIRGCHMGAIYTSGASPTLRNLTIVNNGVGVYVGHEGGEPYITNCIFWGNGIHLFQAKAYFSYVHGQPDTKTRNISGDPLFADPSNGDFHLKSQYGRYVPEFDTWVMDNMTSLCIDAGNPQDYFEAEIEPNGAIINMGAYGGTPYASKSRY